MLLTFITGLIFMFLFLLQCKPISYAWTRVNLADPNSHGMCLSDQILINMTYVYTSFAALCDFTVGILPIFIVLQLKMRRQTKIAVAGILGMACM